MAFTKLEPQPAQRAEEDLVRTDDPATSPYDQPAPGLYPDEIAVVLDTGELVAVSVSSPWLGNNGGIELRGWARLIGEDGQTVCTPSGLHIELEISHNVESPKVNRFSRDTLAKEMLLLLLGEPATIVEYDNPPLPEEERPEGWTPTFEAPMIPWSDDFRLESSIQHAMACAAAGADELDPGALLDL